VLWRTGEVCKVKRLACLASVVCLAIAAPRVEAQFQNEVSEAVRYGPERVYRYRCGVIVWASGGPCRGIVATAPLPSEWPEQKVTIVEEDFSPGTRVAYRTVEGSVRQMVVQIPFLAPGHELRAVVTTEVRRRPQLPPDDPDSFVLPPKRRLPRAVRPYLGPSPGIESTSAKIVRLARQIAPDEQVAWKKVEAIGEWVRENIQYQDGRHQGAIATLERRTGCNEDLVSVFIALCRANGIPARTVWIYRGCYAEFYLQDSEGQGHWFPCRLTGTPAFGQMPDTTPILEKGDNFRSPTDPRRRRRFLAETLSGAGGTPQKRFIRELVGQ